MSALSTHLDSLSSGPEIFPKISGCTLNRFVAKGGMGRIYAGQRNADGLQICAKLPRHSMKDDIRYTDQLHQEFLALQRINHPLVVKCLYSGVCNDGAYLLLEWIPGQTLQNRLNKSGAMPWVEAYRLFEQLLETVSLLHEQRVVHADLKLENIMLRRNYTGGVEPVIIDFGAACVDGQWGCTKDIYGTPGYISPEVLAGGTPTSRSDVYALAGIFFELLTGHSPFTGSVAEIVKQQLDGASPVLQVECDRWGTIGQLILTGLDPNPNNRFKDGAEMLAALYDAAAVFFPSSETGAECSRTEHDGSTLWEQLENASTQRLTIASEPQPAIKPTLKCWGGAPNAMRLATAAMATQLRKTICLDTSETAVCLSKAHDMGEFLHHWLQMRIASRSCEQTAT